MAYTPTAYNAHVFDKESEQAMSEIVQWMEDGTPYSPRFGDRYRSEAAHAVQQAEQVFLAGVGLPAAWAGQPQWRILETGFGFGLNFLATWHAWRGDAARSQLLHFVSTEAFPVSADDLLRHAEQFPHLQAMARELAAQWWGLLPGVHRLRFDGGRVLLTLLVGDTQAMLRQQDMVVDSIYLDGFSPARNPQMWSLHTLKAVARCARRGTRLATWTIAAQVRKDLAQCGFQVNKVPGVPPKRDNLHATFDPAWEPRKAPLWALGTHAVKATDLAAPLLPTAVVIGAGIAGAACAHQLALRGWQVTVLDAAPHPAAGASALPAGIFAPHTSSDDSVLSRITRAGVRTTWQWARELLQAGEDWAPTGVLERRHLATPRDETAAHAEIAPDHAASRRTGAHERPAAWSTDPALAQAAAAWSTHASADVLAAQGLPADDAALWHTHAGWLRPAALVQALLQAPGIRFVGRAQVAQIKASSDAATWSVRDAAGAELARAHLVVVCAGPHSNAVLAAMPEASAPQPLPLQSIRGQVSWATYGNGEEPARHHPVNGHGSWVPFFKAPAGAAGAAEPAWVMGSSFERDVTELPPSPADAARAHGDNWAKLQTLLPAASQVYTASFATARTWAQVRCASVDRLPVVGPRPVDGDASDSNDSLNGRMPPWVCTAMGSRGLSWSLLCAELLAARLHDEPLPVANNLAKALSTDRTLPARSERSAQP
ncbi:tRNA 5-methylaminomethyl-2-thiouridine biosynthesis bifunctional protein [Comamonas sp. 4034]